MKKIPAGLSNKHIHLSQKDIEILFGAGHELTNMKELGQPGQYACEEKVDLVGPKNTLKGIRVLGPARAASQVEISLADGRAIGINPPIKNSGDIAGTPGAKLVGPKGEVEMTEGVIAAARHIHMHTSDGAEFGVKDNEMVKVVVDGPRGLTFDNVLVRVHETFALEFHVDLDEGNACCLKNGQGVELLKY